MLYISGYADDDMLSRGVNRDEEPVLNKPFTGEELLHLVRGLLDKTHRIGLSERGSAVTGELPAARLLEVPS